MTQIQVQAILFKNSFLDIYRSVSSLAAAAASSETMINICYGDASPVPCLDSDQVIDLEEEFGFSIDYRFFDENTGYGKGHNILSEYSTSDYLLPMNPDIIVESTFFDNMLAPFSADPTVGIVEARQTPIEHPKCFNTETGETDWCSGACFLIPVSLFRELEGFDSGTFWMYCEDVDLSWRVQNSGYKTIYQPMAAVFHAKRLTKSAHIVPSDTERYYSGLTALTFAYKWSNDERLELLMNQFSTDGDRLHAKALSEFNAMKAEGRLPDRLVAPERVRNNWGKGMMSEHRFAL